MKKKPNRQTPEPAARRRRSLTHVGGAIETEGDPVAAPALAHALQVTPAPDDESELGRAHIHGFHTYPARLHPETARRLVEAFVPAGGAVLDPFCGSGTVLIEAQLLGRRAWGVDLNPLAVRLAQCKLRPREPGDDDRMLDLARAIATEAHDRRKAKAGATRRYPPADAALFDPHVLLELDSLRAGIARVADAALRGDLQMALSAILVKLSRRPGDTSRALAPRRIAAGYPARLFVEKAEDLHRRRADRDALLPGPTLPATIELGDATMLRRVPGQRLDAIITSPPYAATYDYLAHHSLRMRWLDLDEQPLVRGELGSRSHYHKLSPQAARDRWADELTRFLRSAAAVLPPAGHLVLVMADSAVASVALRADELIADLGRAAGFAPLARASQVRPHFHLPTQRAFDDRPRREHALLLRRDRPPARR